MIHTLEISGRYDSNQRRRINALNEVQGVKAEAFTLGVCGGFNYEVHERFFNGCKTSRVYNGGIKVIAVIRDIDTDGESLEVTCAYSGERSKIETCSFRFAKNDKVSDNDSRLFEELFGFDSVVSDSSESEDFESVSISGAAAEIADYPERYINEIVYFTEAPKDGAIPAEAVHKYEERPEDRETLESLRRVLLNG